MIAAFLSSAVLECFSAAAERKGRGIFTGLKKRGWEDETECSNSLPRAVLKSEPTSAPPVVTEELPDKTFLQPLQTFLFKLD